MILQTAPPPSSIPAVLLILAVWGAIADWRYRRKGGTKSTKREKIFFMAALALVGAVFITFWLVGGSRGAGPEISGYTAVPFTILLFATWELGRWRVRHKNPLPKTWSYQILTFPTFAAFLEGAKTPRDYHVAKEETGYPTQEAAMDAGRKEAERLKQSGTSDSLARVYTYQDSKAPSRN
jgi:hypothetical protein